MTFLSWLLAIALSVYVASLAVLFFKQRSLIFPIPETRRTTPEAAGFPQAEEHFLTTADREKIIVWHVPAKPGHSVVIYFPGNGDFLAGRTDRFRSMTSDGIGLVAVSYRGYAGSSGQPSERGLLLDADAAYTFAATRYRPDQIVLWGFSLGSGVAVALAAKSPIGKLILEAPYTSIAEVAGLLFPIAPARWMVRDQFRSDKRIGRVTAPLLVMNGGRDSTISIKLGERLFALARQPKQFAAFPEGGHDDLGNFGAIEAALRFIGVPRG
jgi:fermentation-respiration switch protein FrsA (DUF1100 family)